MNNPLRYSHGKMNENLMRVSQQAAPDASRTLNFNNGPMQNLGVLRPSSEMLNAGTQGTPESA